jgi:hypothetical protein
VTGGGNSTAGVGPDGSYDGTMGQDKSSMNSNRMNHYRWGGQAGANTALPPQPKGEWTHTQMRGPDGRFTFHAGTASAPPGTEINEIVCSDPGGCSPSGTPPSPAKQIDFNGIGTFKNFTDEPDSDRPIASAYVVTGESYHWFEVHIEDLGEPGGGPTGVDKKNISCSEEGPRTDAFADPPIYEPADCGCSDYYRIRIYQGFVPDFDPVTGEVLNANMVEVIYEVSGYIDHGNFQIHFPTGYDLK